ncbi:lipopolysaccharide biosynthesis protein [Bacteroides xylanisolvens]|jgi:capsular polysaccharide repeat unit transporter|uniref:lipopolysaccharide biosynthesis protein n=1 Tax=Bacteroides xylanisolvens TaxID=371601 RepID=UPI001CDCF50D|nr:lipopolysaccharide biosynthesis protein [Bacteroides xylanisolvens]MCA4454474.1 lipopolysaccharide biosynthesis protein [Bacteroides xylanisolvens]MCA4459185.1 lipopolysaccharide biosynthesis protein [Bacteroides xylanisolvens]MCA4472779.1 lipopolysaccharide biosynthesis protein [Bacteroides xylanisolvens]MCA4481928.1 lipopolysaccharide biosynthesis protein [Bacteroides xylanisolvens]MCE9416051.1 lipopolysaccharide biosynthesis protein [Bacteroides xylanisolvens]
MAEENLKKKTVRGYVWNFMDNILNRGISFVVGIVLAHLISPIEYGLIGIILIFIAVFNSIVESGLGTALVRKNDCKEEDYNTVFYSNLVLSIFLFTIFYFCSPLIAQFFKEPQLDLLGKVMGTILLINSLSIIQNTILLKRLDFKGKMFISMGSSLASGVIGIYMAYQGYGVWSLAGQQISRQLVNALLLWFHNKWMPKLIFSWKSFKELFGFGSNLLVAGIIDTIWNQLYQIVIGRCYTPKTLGLYTKANEFGSIFSSNLTSVVQSVSFPSLSKIQDDLVRLKAGYKKVITCSMLLSFPLMMGMAAVAEPMIKLLIGNVWLPCVPFLQIICFQQLLYPLHAINLSLLQVRGRSELFLKIQIIKKIMSAIPLILGVFVGIYYMLFGSVIVGFVAYYINAYYSRPLLSYGIKEQIKDITPSFLISFFMATIVYLVSFLPLKPLALICLQIPTGIIIEIALCEIFRLSEYKEIKGIILSAIKK